MFENTLTKKVLTQNYLVDNLTKAEIARRYNTTVKTVNAYMDKHGIDKRTRWERVRANEGLVGRVFGRLTVIRLAGTDKHQKSKWICSCVCGKRLSVNRSSLIRNLTLSCGCFKSELARRGGYQEISASFWRRLVTSAAERGYAFSLTKEYIWNLYEAQGRKCALTGVPVDFCPDSNHPEKQTASVDRIDSHKDYVPGNIQILSKMVNLAKSWFDQEGFITMCNLVAEKNRRSYESCFNKFPRGIARKVRS